MPTNNDASAEVLFEYTGEGSVVPTDVTIVRFHPSVTEVEIGAFSYCNKLREVVFNVGLKKIGNDAFRKCTSLQRFTIPSTVTEIGNDAFHYCSDLREVIFNEGLQKIGHRAFDNCTSLSNITLPSTVTELEHYAFFDCNHLREVVLNNGLQKIGGYAFSYCTSLSSIAIPFTVTEVDRYAFYGCRSLREVALTGVPQEIGGGYVFRYCTSVERFTFPTISSRLDTLIQTGHWEEIKNEVDEVRGVVERSGGELFVSAQTMGEGRNWNTVRRDIEKIVRLVAFYESQLPILDIAFTDTCDIGVPGPAKDIILQYLI